MFKISNKWHIINNQKKLINVGYKNIAITNMGDFGPLSSIKFNNCKNLYIGNCNKNFVYYFLDFHTFPLLQEIYLDNNICEYCVFSRFNNSNVKMYISPLAYNINRKWSDDFSFTINVNQVDDDKLKKLIFYKY